MEGNWVNKGTDIDNVVLNYFQNFFISLQGDMSPVIKFIEQKNSTTKNVLSRKVEEEVKKALFKMNSD